MYELWGVGVAAPPVADDSVKMPELEPTSPQATVLASTPIDDVERETVPWLSATSPAATM